MTKIVMMLFALLTTACYDVSTCVNVAPSAHSLSFRIERAVLKLNLMLGYQLYYIDYVNSERRVNNEIIVRKKLKLSDKAVGMCQLTSRGVIVDLLAESQEIHIAHELCHAMGLEHSPLEDNLMYYAPRFFNLTPNQIDYILNAPAKLRK